MRDLRETLEQMPSGSLVPRDWVLERLDEEPDPDGLDRLYSVPELAEHFDRSEATIRSWCSSGKLRAMKVEGREWRVRGSEVRACEERMMAGPSW